MKKLGLRALAGGLALLMVAGLGAPATAKAQDDLLILAPAKELKVLEITKDMVDEDGEIVISGGEYDLVVVSRDVDAKDIYFDQVVVKEMVVESGNKATVQLWEVDADQVTVQEPQIEAFPMKDLLPLLKDADDKTRQAVIDAFNEYQADVKDASMKAPTIVTKEDAKVDALVARANAKLDLGEGAVEVVALEAGEKATRSNVTLSNYEGNVTYKGGDGFSAMNLKTVDSRITNLKVEESAVNNYFTLTSQDTVVLNTEVAGNANVTLNAMMGAVEITEAATAANVAIMNVVEELNVAGKGAKVELSGNANVTFATVTSDDVKITGVGSLGEADLQGKGAYVSTFGTKVEGENTYVPYTTPMYDSWSEDFSDADLVAGVPTDGASMNWASYAYDAENGYGVVTTKNGWEGFAIELNNRDNGSSANFTISLKVKKLGGSDSAVRVTENPAWPNLADITSISDSWTYVTAKNISVAAGASRVIMIAPATGQGGVTLEMAVDDVKVERYTEWTEPPARPKPTENVTYDFSQMTKSNSYGCTTTVVDGALKIVYDKQYQEAQYDLPQGMFSDDYDKIVVDFEDCVGTITFKVFAGGKNILEATNKDSDCIIDLSEVPGYEVTKIGIMQSNAGEGTCNAVINGFTFVVAGTDVEIEAEPPKAPAELPADYLVYDMATLAPEEELTNIGGLELSFDKQYAQTTFVLPEAINVADYEKMIVTLSSATGAVAFKTYDGETETNAWYGKSATKTTDIEVNLADVKDQESAVTAFALMSNDGACEAIVYRVAFVPKKAQEEGVTLPALPENADAYTFAQGSLTEASEGSWGYGGAAAIVDGVLNADFSQQYAEAKYMFSKTYKLGDIKNLIFTLSDVTDDLAVKLYDATGNKIGVWYGVSATDVDNKYCNIEYIGADDGSPIYSTLSADTEVGGFGVMANNGACKATVYRVAVETKEAVGNTLPALPENADAYTFVQGSLSEASEGSWGYGGAAAIVDGVLNADFSQQYAEAKYMFSKTYKLGDIKNLIFTLSDVTDDLAVKLYDATGNKIGVWYGVSATDVDNKYCNIEYIGADDGSPIYSTLSADTEVGGFGVMANNGACKATVYRVAVETK